MSTRTKEIIQIVVAEHGYITIKDIAGKMNISERTVYREIPEITDVLSEYAPADLFLDPAVDFAKYIKQDLERSGLLTSSVLQNKEEFYVSANPEQFKISAQMFYELKSNPELLTFKNLV